MQQLISLTLLLMTLAFMPALPASAQSLAQTGQTASDAERIAQLETDLAATENLLMTVDAQLRDYRSREQSDALETAQAQNAAITEFLGYQSDLRAHALAIFTWQLRSAYVVLALVVAVTMLGVVLSYMEVRNAMRAPEKVMKALGAAQAQEGEPDTPPVPGTGANLVISAQKLQVTSAITGVVILVLSLAFLYLFVNEVLEAKVIDFATPLAPQIEAAAEQ